MNDDDNAILDSDASEPVLPIRSHREIAINRVLIIVVGSLLFVALTLEVSGFIIDSIVSMASSLSLSILRGLVSTFATLGVVGLLYWNGTLVNRKTYKRVLLFFVLLLFLSQIFKIMHLAGASEILMVSMIGIFLDYGIHFVTKPKKIPLDYLKMGWVIIVVSTILVPFTGYYSLPWQSVIVSRIAQAFMFGGFAISYFRETSTQPR